MPKNPVAKIQMKNGKEILIELYPEIAPNTVNNFIALSDKGFYKDLIFHRVIPGFMIQGGCPLGLGMGGPGYAIKGEFPSNGFDNNLEHKRGVISMARSQAPNSAGSQFFIMHDDAPHLDGQYAAFGKVMDASGLYVVDEIVSANTDYNDRPYEPSVIENIDIDTFGEVYPQPEILEEK